MYSKYGTPSEDVLSIFNYFQKVVSAENANTAIPALLTLATVLFQAGNMIGSGIEPGVRKGLFGDKATPSADLRKSLGEVEIR